MKRYAPSASLIVAAFLFWLVAGGCMTVRQTFDGYDQSHVWSVMTAVAESPEYDDWHVITNEVWHAPDEARMEVYRQVQRSVREPGLKPRSERRDWRFRIEMLDTHPPTARLVSRGWAVPAHARIEGDRYFADVWQMLGDRPVRVSDPVDEFDDLPPIELPETVPDPDEDATDPEPESEPAQDRDAPPIDVDDVTGDG